MDVQQIRSAIEKFIDAETPAMFAMLENIVNRDSGSSDVDDVNKLGDYLAETLEAMGCAVTKHRHERFGYPVSALTPGTGSETRKVMLIGHRDTVFPAGTAAARPFANDGTLCRGPGVADMKSGLVSGIFAIKAVLALRETTGHIPLEIVISSDEEIGSAASAPVLADRARFAKAVLSLEPARPEDKVVTARDGGDLFELDVHGKAAHAGNNFLDGVSAVNALAAITLDLSALSDDPGGMNVNVGIVSGGSGAIIVPEHAQAKVSMRFTTLEQQSYLRGKVRDIVAKHNRDGVRVELSDFRGFLPFRESPDNTKLFHLVQSAGKELGMNITGMTTRGPADSGVTASAGAPTICGMGPIGANLHTDQEYMETASFPQHAKLIALSILMASQTFS